MVHTVAVCDPIQKDGIVCHDMEWVGWSRLGTLHLQGSTSHQEYWDQWNGNHETSGDESTHQILSNGLLFSTFYCFPYTTDPPTHTTQMWPSMIFTQSPLTIPYTHHTISPVPHRRPPIWPTDHIVIFSFLSLFSFTRCILLQPNQSQVITPHSQDLTIHFTTHKPCAHFTYHLYLILLYLLWKRRKFFPRTQTQVHFVSLFHLAPSHTFALFCTITPSRTFILHSLILRQETISLLSNHTPQSHIGYILRSLTPLIFVAS